MSFRDRPRPELLVAKVPEITVLFWVVKVLTTGMGEAASDFLGNTNLLLAGVVGVFGFAFTLRRQLYSRAYDAVTYWSAVAMVAVFGTMVADIVHVAGLPYVATTSIYGALLALVFIRWRRSEGTLSIHSIVTPRRETFYWLTVLATFALGTAAGDLTATTLNLGFFGSGVLFGVAILVPLVAWRLGANPVLAFWTAYVLTRPLGASFADWFGKPHSISGGLGFGDGAVAGVALAVIIGLVAYLALRRNDIQKPAVISRHRAASTAHPETKPVSSP